MRRSITQILAGAVALVLLIVGGAWLWWQLAGLAAVERWAAESLRARGIPVAEMTLRSVGWDRAVLADIRVGVAGGIVIKKIEARYRVGDVIRDGHIERLDIAGIRADLSSARPPPDGPLSAGATLPALPFGVIVASDSEIAIATPVGTVRLAGDLEARPMPDGAIELAGRAMLRAEQGQADLPFTGAVAPDGRFDLSLTIEAGDLAGRGASLAGLRGSAVVAGGLDGLRRVEFSVGSEALTLPGDAEARFSVFANLADGTGRMGVLVASETTAGQVTLDASLDGWDTARPAVSAGAEADLPLLSALLELAGLKPGLTADGTIAANFSGHVERQASGPLASLDGDLTVAADLALPAPGSAVAVDLGGVLRVGDDGARLTGETPWRLDWTPAAGSQPIRLTLAGRPGDESRVAVRRRADAWEVDGAAGYDLIGPGAALAGRIGLSVTGDGIGDGPGGRFLAEVEGSGKLPGQVTVEDGAAELAGGFALRDGSWRLTAQSCLPFSAARLSIGPSLTAPDGVSGCASAAAGRPMLTYAPGGEGRLGLDLAVRAEPFALLVATAGAAVPVELDLPDVSIEAGLAGDGGPVVDLVTGGASMRLPTLGLAVEAIAATLSAGADRDRRARLRLDGGRALSLDDPARFVPLGLSGHATLTGPGRLDFAGTAIAAAGAVVARLNGRHDLLDGSGEADIQVEPVSFAPGVRHPADLVPSLGLPDTVEVTGTVVAGARLGWGGRPASSGEIRLEDLSLAGPGAAVRGINGTLYADSLFPLGFPDGQLLTVEGADIGVGLGRGAIAFGLADGSRLSVQGMGFELADGVLAVEPFQTDIGDREHAAALNLQGVDLGPLSQQLELEGLTVTGRLSGRVPIRLVDDTIAIEDGVLETAEPGVIRYVATLPGIAEGEGGVALLLSAVRNFQYEGLRVTLNGQTGDDLQVTIRLTGANPDLYEGFPIALNINLSGRLDEILRSGLNSMAIADEAGGLLRGGTPEGR